MAAASSGESGAELQSYSQIAKKTAKSKVIQVTLVRYQQNISYNLSGYEVSKLAHKRLGIPLGGLEFIDDSEFRTLKFYLKPNVDVSKLNLNEAFEVKDGVRTKPVSLDKRDTWVNIYWTSVETDDRDIVKSLSYFGIVTSSIEHMVYKSKSDEDPLAKYLDGVKKGDRRVKMQIHKNIPSYIIIDQKRVKVTYEGQVKTCRRCHRFVNECKGDGDVLICEQAGTKKVELNTIWDEFIDENEQFSSDDADDSTEKLEPFNTVNTDVKNFEISGFPADVEKEIIIGWLNEYCDVQIDINDLNETEYTGRYIVTNMDRKERTANAKKIKGKKFFADSDDEDTTPIYVNIWTPNTPAKVHEEITVSSDDSQDTVDPKSSNSDEYPELPVPVPAVAQGTPPDNVQHVSETDSTPEAAQSIFDKQGPQSVQQLKMNFEVQQTAGGTLKYKLKEHIDKEKKKGNKRLHESSTPDSEVDYSKMSKSQRKKYKKRQKKLERDLEEHEESSSSPLSSPSLNKPK